MEGWNKGLKIVFGKIIRLGFPLGKGFLCVLRDSNTVVYRKIFFRGYWLAWVGSIEVWG
jgi:hypothetical protein